MQIPYSHDCVECGKNNTHWAHITDIIVNCKCPCGYNSEVHVTLTITTGLKILYKSGYELEKNNDSSLSIVLSAMAFEAEQFRLYKKWHNLDVNLLPEQADKEVRGLFRNAKNVSEKFNLTVQKIAKVPFDEYISQHQDLYSAIKSFQPDSNEKDVLKLFHDVLFGPRNEIMHGSKYSYSKEEALAVYNMASNGIVILKRIDQERRKEFLEETGTQKLW